eukprot:TRINITY_DN19693_c0_g1_i2.p1 TRINITY_DN19693_c0_g1~~TRINITY_DN19693_c0_g1_i2.p1  ORF type:complete len:128 (-),score=28.94 TRINITY_DN19693_c0_g1_i2:178-561(-)
MQPDNVREPLTNREVYDMLRQRTDHRMSQGKVTSPVEQNALAYLEEQLPGCGASEEMLNCTHTPDQIAKFFHSVESFNFSDEEKLQLVNLRPRSELELSLILWGLADWEPAQVETLFALLADAFDTV